ncbi:MAG: hypothetical protein WA364_11710, partial [Candidatus Nitrosopolaris sp.]
MLNILNKDCVDKATIAYTEIDWTKFHKLDLLLLIPAIILESLFILFTIEVIPSIATSMAIKYIYGYSPTYQAQIATQLILRTIGSFFIIRLTLKAT